MTRITDSEIERLKKEISLVRLIESAGIRLTKKGEDLAGQCPFHEDDKQSLDVSPEKNLWRCFGCDAGGGVIEWVMKKNGVSLRHAVELLRDGTPDITDAPVRQSRVRVLQAPVTDDADDQKLLDQVIGYYHSCLKQSPEALDYLKARGLANTELIDTFRLGYANRTLGLRLPEKNRKAGAAIRARLEKLGVYRESGHEHFNGSLVVPVLDRDGQVQCVYGRKIRDDLRKGTPLDLSLPEPHRGVWNVQALTASEEIILCKSLIDAMTFWCAGYRHVTAHYGTEGLTADMMDAFKRHGSKRILIAYDRTETGELEAGKAAARLRGAGIDCWRILLPHGMDANEYSLKVGSASAGLGMPIRKAEWMGEGKAPTRTMREPDTAVIRIEPKEEIDEEDSSLAAELAAIAADDVDTGAAQQPAPVLPASPAPPAPRCDLDAAVSETEVVLSFPSRRWRVRGLPKNLAVGVLKVNVMVSRDDAFHVDTLDLYNARARSLFTQQAALELRAPEDEIRGELGRVLLKLEQVQDETIQKALAPKAPAHAAMSEEEHERALALLKAPDLLDRILADLARCGLTGEESNALTAYVAATSRKLASPLGVVVQSSSAAGKTSLMDAILAFIPEEDKVRYSAMTGQSLYYLGEISLKNKVLALAEEEGAQRAAYALKLLQSEGELNIASTGADASGNLITREYRVEGPTALMTTTTAIDVDEELMNRCIVLAVDEGRDQTRAIHARQRERRTLEGLRAREERKDLFALHQNAQRLLMPLAVVNPFAGKLTFLDDRTRTRRDHEKYLTLIDAIALLHQYQRPVKMVAQGERTISYIEVTRDDIERATKLAHEVLGRSLDDLPPQTRRLLSELMTMVEVRAAEGDIPRRAVRFTRRELRERLGWGDTQLKLHLARLVDMELLLAHRGQGGRFDYELIYDGSGAATPHLSGLIDPQALDHAAARSGQNGARSASGREPDGGPSAGGQGCAAPGNADAARVTGESGDPDAEEGTAHVEAR